VIDFYARSSSTPIAGVPNFDTKHVLDGERKMEFLKPLPVTSEGRNFEICSSVIGVYDKGKPGTVVETEQLLVDKDTNEVYTRAVGSGFYVGQGGWGGPKGRSWLLFDCVQLDVSPKALVELTHSLRTGPKTVNYPPPQNKAPDASVALQTTNETALLYRLNGDYNPLHATPEPGMKMGFGGPIIHGLFSWNSAAHIVLQQFGGSNPANIKSFQARFASPVKPGDKLFVDMWRMGKTDADGFEEIRFIVRVDGGKVCLSNGQAFVKMTSQSKSKL